MFDFYKEVIINSATLPDSEGRDSEGQLFKKFSGADASGNKEAMFRVLRCADYVKSCVKDGKIYKTFGRKGSVAQAEFELTSLASVPGQYRILIDVSLEGRYYSDYKYPWSEFHKLIMAEFEVTTDMSGSADKVAEAAVKALKAYIPSDYKYAVSMTAETGKVKVLCTDPYQVIKSAKIQKLEESGCYDGCSDKEYVDSTATVAITKNVAPFATGEWLTENLRFPTYPNLRYASANEDERPIPGATYVQYAFEYVSPRRGLTGQGTVGQALSSVTHHVFYVLDSLAAAFDDAISKIGEIVYMNGQVVILNGGENQNEITVTVAQVQGEKVNLKATFSEQLEGNAEFEWSIQMTQGSGYSVDPTKGASTTVKCLSAANGDNGVVTAKIGEISVSKTIKVTE